MKQHSASDMNIDLKTERRRRTPPCDLEAEIMIGEIGSSSHEQ
jgi:hypothetical protein